MSVFTVNNLSWLVGYGIVVCGVVFLLNNYRSRAIADYGTPEARQNWQEWRDAAEAAGKQGSVGRSKPESAEPPSLVLMRDHFPAIVGISTLLTTCLYLWFMVCVRGVLKPVTLHPDDFD